MLLYRLYSGVVVNGVVAAMSSAWGMGVGCTASSSIAA
eukprot:COSAG04_NODE_23641_length_335_cov_0.644068_2_plen_37_part_01